MLVSGRYLFVLFVFDILLNEMKQKSTDFGDTSSKAALFRSGGFLDASWTRMAPSKRNHEIYGEERGSWTSEPAAVSEFRRNKSLNESGIVGGRILVKHIGSRHRISKIQAILSKQKRCFRSSTGLRAGVMFPINKVVEP